MTLFLYIVLGIVLFIILLGIIIFIGVGFFNWAERLEVIARNNFANTTSPFIKAKTPEIKEKKGKDKHNTKKLLSFKADNRNSGKNNVF